MHEDWLQQWRAWAAAWGPSGASRFAGASSLGDAPPAVAPEPYAALATLIHRRPCAPRSTAFRKGRRRRGRWRSTRAPIVGCAARGGGRLCAVLHRRGANRHRAHVAIRCLGRLRRRGLCARGARRSLLRRPNEPAECAESLAQRPAELLSEKPAINENGVRGGHGRVPIKRPRCRWRTYPAYIAPARQPFFIEIASWPQTPARRNRWLLIAGGRSSTETGAPADEARPSMLPVALPEPVSLPRRGP